jgi:site-specific DNA-methyltransferase (adenine-specific)
MRSSLRGDWSTPQETFDALHKEFGFTLDACATRESAKCPHYFTIEDNALTQSWDTVGAVYMNPPYGREIGKWIRKARLEGERGVTVVCLIPSRTDTRWWHEDVMKASEIRFIKGRLHFDERGPAPFPSAIVIFRKE